MARRDHPGEGESGIRDATPGDVMAQLFRLKPSRYRRRVYATLFMCSTHLSMCFSHLLCRAGVHYQIVGCARRPSGACRALPVQRRKVDGSHHQMTTRSSPRCLARAPLVQQPSLPICLSTSSEDGESVERLRCIASPILADNHPHLRLTTGSRPDADAGRCRWAPDIGGERRNMPQPETPVSTTQYCTVSL